MRRQFAGVPTSRYSHREIRISRYSHSSHFSLQCLCRYLQSTPHLIFQRAASSCSSFRNERQAWAFQDKENMSIVTQGVVSSLHQSQNGSYNAVGSHSSSPQKKPRSQQTQQNQVAQQNRDPLPAPAALGASDAVGGPVTEKRRTNVSPVSVVSLLVRTVTTQYCP